MLFRGLFTAGLAATALAAPAPVWEANEIELYNRYFAGEQVYTISEAGQTLYDDLKKLDTDTVAIGAKADAFTGDATQAVAIQTASEALAKDIKLAQSNVKKQTGLYGVQEAINLLPIFDTFIPDIKKVMDTLIQKKDLFDKTSTTSVVLAALQRQKDLGTKLNDMVVARLPAIAKPIDKKQWGALTEQLDRGIAAFGGAAAGGADAAAAAPAS